MTIPVQRMTYVDVIKGVAMLLVVMHHCGGSLDKGMEVLTMVDVPLFFMCSGYLAYKERINYPKELRKKTVGILIPFILAVIIASLIRGVCIIEIFTDITKSGYWFLQVLYMMFLLWWGISIFHNKFVVCNLLGGVELALLLAAKFMPETFDNIFCFSSLARYFPCFIVGIFLRKYRLESLNNKIIGLILLISSVIGFTGWPLYLNSNISFLLCTIAYSTSAVLIFLFIRKIEFQIPDKLRQSLMTIGRYSLNVYIIHFYFVPNAPAFLPHSFIVDLIYSISMAVIITCVSILIGTFLTFSTPLNKVLQ